MTSLALVHHLLSLVLAQAPPIALHQAKKEKGGGRKDKEMD